jgi:hypothetical protein
MYMPFPSDPSLYSLAKRRIVRKMPRHSAYRSAHIVRLYKDMFQKVHGSRRSPYNGPRNAKQGLLAWFRENKPTIVTKNLTR